jgi:hypothetical protein
LFLGLAGVEVSALNAAALWLVVVTVNPAAYPTAYLIVNLTARQAHSYNMLEKKSAEAVCESVV